MRYAPSPSVITERVFSMSTSLEASTVTPGSTAPDVSLTRPAMALWACAAAGSQSTHASAPTPANTSFRIIQLPPWRVTRPWPLDWADYLSLEAPEGEKVSIKTADPAGPLRIRKFGFHLQLTIYLPLER